MIDSRVSPHLPVVLLDHLVSLGAGEGGVGLGWAGGIGCVAVTAGRGTEQREHESDEHENLTEHF